MRKLVGIIAIGLALAMVPVGLSVAPKGVSVTSSRANADWVELARHFCEWVWGDGDICDIFGY